MGTNTLHAGTGCHDCVSISFRNGWNAEEGEGFGHKVQDYSLIPFQYRERQDVIIALQTLAFLQEYCRYHKARYMEMVQTKDEERYVTF